MAHEDGIEHEQHFNFVGCSQLKIPMLTPHGLGLPTVPIGLQAPEQVTHPLDPCCPAVFVMDQISAHQLNHLQVHDQGFTQLDE